MTWQDEAWEHHMDLPMKTSVLAAVEANVEDVRRRDQEYRETAGAWWVVYPPWMWKHREKIKERWPEVHRGLPVGNLKGFEFANEWPIIGQRFTYDWETGEWDR